jgi:hypothetical protein
LPIGSQNLKAAAKAKLRYRFSCYWSDIGGMRNSIRRLSRFMPLRIGRHILKAAAKAKLRYKSSCHWSDIGVRFSIRFAYWPADSHQGHAQV